MKMFTTETPQEVIKYISEHFDQLAIVGKGAQARWMRNYLKAQCRLKLDNVPGNDSSDVPCDRSLYLVCATPENEVIKILIENNIQKNRLIIWTDLFNYIEQTDRSFSLHEMGLPSLNNKDDLLLPGLPEHSLSNYLYNASQTIASFILEMDYSSTENIKNLDFLLNNYLTIREYYASILDVKPKKLLFPSTGRCGGVSLTNALETHPSLYFKVCHEGYAEQIYMLLALYKKNKISKKMMTGISCFILDQYDCHGGNPFCFLMPFIKDISWFEFYILIVRRDRTDLLESITQRNFHYTEKDFVPNRITAEQWGDESKADWSARDINSKVEWYIDKVEQEIYSGVSNNSATIEIPIEKITQGLNEILKLMNFPEIREVPHLNAIPKDKIFSLEERIKLFKEIK